MSNLGRRFKVALLHKGSSLIYFGMSKNPYESTNFLRRQLEILHLQIISITTNQIIKTLKYNPSFDVVTDIYYHVHLINAQVESMQTDPFTFTNFFIPLRMHPDTRDMITYTISRIKPDTASFYFGAILAEKTVVSLIKNDPKITIIPSGKFNMLI